MNMRGKIELASRVLALLVVLFVSSPAAAGEGDASPNWGEAGREIKEAARAIGKASKETWHLAKEKGKEVWRETKETTVDVVRKTKKKIHDATAPKTAPQEPVQGTTPQEHGSTPEPAHKDPGAAPQGPAPVEPEPKAPQVPAPVPQGNDQPEGAGGQTTA